MRERIPLFFTLNTVTISELFKQQLDQLIEQDRESQQKTQATLTRIRGLISDLKAIDLED